MASISGQNLRVALALTIDSPFETRARIESLVEVPGPEIRPPSANGTAFRVRKGDADVRVLSPVDGEVVAAGGPDSGWYLKVRPAAAGEAAFRHLLRGAEIKPWLLREMDRLQKALSPTTGADTMADGGVLVADLTASCPKADWDAVCGEMFLEP